MKKAIYLLVVGASALVFLATQEPTQPVQRPSGTPPAFEAGAAGGSLESASLLQVALPIINAGKQAVQGVRVTKVAMPGGILATKLPLVLGTIAPEESGTAFLSFEKGPFVAGQAYAVQMAGTFSRGEAISEFSLTIPVRIPPASPGEAAARSSSSPPHTVKGAPYPHRPPSVSEEDSARMQWTVPIGSPHALTKQSGVSSVKPAPKGDPPGVNFLTNASVGVNSSAVNEPSGAVGGGLAFMTANWFAAYSTNAGGSFTQVSPYTVFPSSVGGFCCDQVAHYVASIDRVVWLMQYSPTANGDSLYRLAAASPANIQSSSGTAWTYWDITSTQLGFPKNSGDYPDVSIGNNSLYLSFDIGSGLEVIRIPLSEIQASTTINFRFTDPSKSPMAWGSHLSQNTVDEIFWAGHNSNSSMRVFNWPESSNSYSWRDIGVSSWPNNNANLTSLTPDRQDWLTWLRNHPPANQPFATRLSGKTTAGQVNQVWFAWAAAAGTGFPQPHVQMVSLNRNNNFQLVAQVQIWNPNYAFSYPAVSSNSSGEVGLSLEFGGGGNYENHVAGFWGDFIVYITTSSTVGSVRFGDYVSIRRDAAHPERFNAFGYGMLKAAAPGAGPTSDTHFVVFSR